MLLAPPCVHRALVAGVLFDVAATSSWLRTLPEVDLAEFRGWLAALTFLSDPYASELPIEPAGSPGGAP